MQGLLGKREALLAAMLPAAALSLLNGFYKGPLFAAGPAWYWLADVAQFVIVPLACWWFLLRPAGIEARALGLQAAPSRRRVDRGTLLFFSFLIVAVTWPIMFFFSRIGWHYADVLPPIMPAGWPARALLVVYMAASAALVEEVVFRALPWLYLCEAMGERWRVPLYLLASTTVFALCHAEQGPAGVAAAAWFGLVAAGGYLRLGSLWPPVLAHFVVDLLFL